MLESGSQFGGVEWLVQGVAAFQEEAWRIATSSQDPGNNRLSVRDREGAKVIQTSNGMCIDLWEPQTNAFDSRQAHVQFTPESPLDFEAGLDALVTGGIVVPSLVNQIKNELKGQLNGALRLGSVVLDDRPTIATKSDLNPFSLSNGFLPNRVDEHGIKLAAATKMLLGLGGERMRPENRLFFTPTVLDIQAARGYRIVGRSVALADSRVHNFDWNGIRAEAGEKGGGAITSMEGERSNLVRAVILEGVRERLKACLSD